MPTHLHSVRLPTIFRYTEAVILMQLKYRGAHQSPFWSSMLTYIEEYVSDDGRLDCGLLPPSMQRYLLDRATGLVKMRTMMDNLEEDWEIEETAEFGIEKIKESL